MLKTNQKTVWENRYREAVVTSANRGGLTPEAHEAAKIFGRSELQMEADYALVRKRIETARLLADERAKPGGLKSRLQEMEIESQVLAKMAAKVAKERGDLNDQMDIARAQLTALSNGLAGTVNNHAKVMSATSDGGPNPENILHFRLAE